MAYFDKDRQYLNQSRRLVKVLKALGLVTESNHTSYYAWEFSLQHPSKDWTKRLSLYLQYSAGWGGDRPGYERFKLYNHNHKIVFATNSIKIFVAYINQHNRVEELAAA